VAASIIRSELLLSTYSRRGPVMTVKRCAADVVQYIKVFQMSAC